MNWKVYILATIAVAILGGFIIGNLTSQSKNSNLKFNWTPTQDAERSDFINESDWNEYIEMRYYQLIEQRNKNYALQDEPVVEDEK